MIDIETIYSPISIDNHWEKLTDSQKFSLWVIASGSYFDPTVPESTKENMMSNIKEVVA